MNTFERFILGFVEIINGVLKVLTLGFYNSNLDYDFCCWCQKRMCNKKRRII